MFPKASRVAVCNMPLKPTSQALRITSRQLLNDGKQIIIEHKGEDYFLRLTSQDKLILTK